jgi:hypothetical protein
MGNYVLHSPCSKINGFLLRDTCVSSTELNRPVEASRAYLHFENCNLQEVFPSKTNSSLREKMW